MYSAISLNNSAAYFMISDGAETHSEVKLTPLFNSSLRTCCMKDDRSGCTTFCP